MEDRNSTIEYRLDQIDEHLDKNDDKLDKLTTLIERVANQGVKLDEISGKQDEITSKLSIHDQKILELENRADKERAQNWKKFVEYILLGVLGAVLVIVLKRIGLQ